MIPFSPPRIDEAILDAVREALLSGWITTGPKTKEFEREITAYTGAGKTICLNSWTNAVELFLRWWGIGPGDEVIIPAYTYSATANVIVHCGAKPVLVDTDSNALMDLNAVRRAITPATKIIMPVDIGGIPFDYEALKDLIEQQEIKSKFKAGNDKQAQLGRILILADAAHSFGATHSGIKSGALADLTGFSFHAVKNLTTAEGGALCLCLPQSFDLDEVYRELNIKSLHGQTKDALSKNQPGAWRYDIVEAGYKCNMTDIQAAIGRVELQRYDQDTLIKRKQHTLNYHSLLGQFDWALLPEHSNPRFESSYHLYMLRIKNATEIQRDRIIAELGERGISSNVHFLPLPLLSFYKGMGYRMEDYPNAYASYANEISLPLFYDLNEGQQETIAGALCEIVPKILAS